MSGKAAKPLDARLQDMSPSSRASPSPRRGGTSSPQASRDSGSPRAMATSPRRGGRKDRNFNTSGGLLTDGTMTSPAIVTDDTYAAELLGTFAARRRLLQRASHLTEEMNEHVHQIAEDASTWQQTSLNNSTKRRHFQSLQSGGVESSPETQGRSDDDEGGIAVAATEEDAIKMKTHEKGEKLAKLRDIQCDIAEMDDFAAEERRRQEVTKQGTERHAVDAPSIITADDLRDILRKHFVTQEEDDKPPAPPTVFSSNALATTLELLGKSLARLVEATDEICVKATFRPRDEQTSLYKQMRTVRMCMSHVEQCHEVAMRHLAHFEVGEKALLEGGAQEVNCLREQFLLRKESLTAYEQRERAAEELRASLQARLTSLNQRCDMWEEVFFGIVRDEPSMKAANSIERRDSTYSASSRLMTGHRRSFSNNNNNNNGGNRGLLRNYLSERDRTSISSAEQQVSQPQIFTDESELERRVAALWGNPYISRAAKPPDRERFLSRRQSSHFMLSELHGTHSTNAHSSVDVMDGHPVRDQLSPPASTSEEAVSATGHTAQSQAVARARSLLLLQKLIRAIPVARETGSLDSTAVTGASHLQESDVLNLVDEIQSVSVVDGSTSVLLRPKTSAENLARRLETRSSIQRIMRFLNEQPKQAAAA